MHIQQVSSRLPNHSVQLLANPQRFELTPFKAAIYHKFIGVENIPIAAPGELKGLFEAALKDAIGAHAEQVGIVVHVHTCPVVGNFGELQLQPVLRRLGLTQAVFIGICANRCASFFDALSLIQAYQTRHPERLGVIVTGECALTQELRLIENVAIAGDAVGALLIGDTCAQDKGDTLLGVSTRVFGEYSRGVWLEGEHRGSYEQSYPLMLRAIISDVLEQAGVTLQEVRYVLPHNVNKNNWLEQARGLGLAPEQLVLENIARTGHCFGTDMMLNWQSMKAQGELRSGDYYLMLAVGLGGAFGAALFKH